MTKFNAANIAAIAVAARDQSITERRALIVGDIEVAADKGRMEISVKASPDDEEWLRGLGFVVRRNRDRDGSYDTIVTWEPGVIGLAGAVAEADQ